MSTPYKDIRLDSTIIPCQFRLWIRLLHDLRTMIERGRSSREDWLITFSREKSVQSVEHR